MGKKTETPRSFSPVKLRRLRGDRAFHTLAVEITQRTGVDMHPETLRLYEAGKSEPRTEKLAAIAAYFGVAIDALFE